MVSVYHPTLPLSTTNCGESQFSKRNFFSASWPGKQVGVSMLSVLCSVFAQRMQLRKR